MSVVTLATARTFLNIDTGTPDAKIQPRLDAAEAIIERRVGPLSATAKTFRVRGSGTTVLALPYAPIITLTSITGKSGNAVTGTYLNMTAGTVEADSEFSEDYYTVVVSAGRATLPGHLTEAVLLMTKHLYAAHRGGNPNAAATEVPLLASAIPASVEALLALEPVSMFGFA